MLDKPAPGAAPVSPPAPPSLFSSSSRFLCLCRVKRMLLWRVVGTMHCSRNYPKMQGKRRGGRGRGGGGRRRRRGGGGGGVNLIHYRSRATLPTAVGFTVAIDKIAKLLALSEAARRRVIPPPSLPPPPPNITLFSDDDHQHLTTNNPNWNHLMLVFLSLIHI